MSIPRNHQNAIIVTPATLKHQIITRINTLVHKAGGSYYGYNTECLLSIQGKNIYGLETKGRDVYVMMVVHDGDDLTSYNANEFFIEELWEIYLICNPIYALNTAIYGSNQE